MDNGKKATWKTDLSLFFAQRARRRMNGMETKNKKNGMAWRERIVSVIVRYAMPAKPATKKKGFTHSNHLSNEFLHYNDDDAFKIELNQIRLLLSMHTNSG